MEVVYEDEDILAINKPAGLLVHETEKSEEKTLVDWLIKNYPEIRNVGESPAPSAEQTGSSRPVFFRPGIVHRLDKDTSGVLLIAKNQKAFDHLKKMFSVPSSQLSEAGGRGIIYGNRERGIKKKYLALVLGKIKNEKGIIDLPIGKSKKDFRKRASIGKLTGKIREAITEYKVLERFPASVAGQQGYTLVEARPKTGRTHQIRAHFKAIGHPLACDKLYGPKNQNCPDGLSRHFLHAASLEFVLQDGSRVMLEADLPEDLNKTLSFLRKLR